MLNNEIDQVRDSFRANFKTALSSVHNKFILSGQVGIGKTELLRNINQHTSESTVICFSTHELKEEFIQSKRFTNYVTTPTPPPSLNNYVTYLSENGSNSDVISNKIKNKYSAYYNELHSIIEFPGNIITTHDAFLCSYFKFNQKLIIFDEIPNNLFGQMQTESLFVLQELLLINMANKSTYQSELDDYLRLMIKKIEQYNPYLPQPLNNTNLIQKLYSNLSSNLKLFINNMKDSHKIVKLFKNTNRLFSQKELFINYADNTMTSFNPFPFEENKKYICFSATPDIELFNTYGFTHLAPTPELKPIADIIHISINTSRVALSSKESREEINKLIISNKIKKVISYKDIILKNKVPDVYFGNAEGTNRYEKEDVMGIVGTPSYGSSYIQGQCILHKKLNFSEHDFTMVNREILVNNKKILFKTFNNNWLVNRHITQIESALIQVIGRLRPFTRYSKIYLFSKLPIYCNN